MDSLNSQLSTLNALKAKEVVLDRKISTQPLLYDNVTMFDEGI
jgi:hypothetical protein